MSVLLDAGPSLNFLAAGQQNILIKIAEAGRLQLAAPERVDAEILGMSNDQRFRGTAVRRTWTALKASRRVEILPDSLASRQFADAVTRIAGMPAQDRVRSRKSLGEIMVLAHASTFVQQGHDVYVLLDDGDGRRRAAREMQWLRSQGHHSGFDLWATRRVLQEAGRHEGWIKGDQTWEQVYDQMTAFDDGLLPRSAWQKRL